MARDRGRGRSRLVGVLALPAVGVLGAAALVHAPATTPARPVAATAGAPRAAAVRDLLGRRAAAVLAHDEPAFLSTVLPGAAAWRRRQAELFRGVQAAGVDRFAYALGPDAPQPDRPDLTRTYGTWWAPRVVLRYRLRGIDPRPVPEPEHPLVVERAGRWYVAGELPAREPGTRPLWDTGPVLAVRGRASLVLGRPGSAQVLQEVAAGVDAAVPRVSAVWGPDWAQRVAVLVPATHQDLTATVPAAGDLSALAALATAELPGAYGGGDRVVVNPAALHLLSATGRRVVLTHEVVHVATRASTGPQTPDWLSEGLADYVGFTGTGVPVPVAAQELRTDVLAGRPPRALPTDAAFAPTSPGLSQAYQQAWLAVRDLVARLGAPGVVALYRALADARTPAGADAVVRARTGQTLAALSATESARLPGLLR